MSGGFFGQCAGQKLSPRLQFFGSREDTEETVITQAHSSASLWILQHQQLLLLWLAPKSPQSKGFDSLGLVATLKNSHQNSHHVGTFFSLSWTHAATTIATMQLLQQQFLWAAMCSAAFFQ